MDAIRRDPAAWAALAGVATHSYNNAATPEMAARRDGKEYWITEAGGLTDTDEAPGDALQATSISARVLNDLNHGATHFVYFIGYELPDPRGNSGRLILYEARPFRCTPLLKYDYLQALAFAFDRGAVLRHCLAAPGGEMTYTYGRKPPVNAAVARNPDGTWAAAVSDFTSEVFRRPGTERWYREQGGGDGQPFDVTLHVEELDALASVAWRVHRCRAGTPAPEAEATMRHGRLTLHVDPLEVVTLRQRQP